MEMPQGQIPSQRCWELLATALSGRLALSVRALPVIVPVQYHVTGGRLTVCLGHHEIPSTSLDNTIVAFSADSIDTHARTGWSVQVQGRSSIARPHGADPTCGEPAVSQVVEIVPGTITGYHVRPCQFIDDLRAGRRASS